MTSLNSYLRITSIPLYGGALCDTPYIPLRAPEQLQEDVEAGPPADLWSWACLVIHLLSGSMPMQGKSPQAVICMVSVADAILRLSQASLNLYPIVCHVRTYHTATDICIIADRNLHPIFYSLPPGAQLKHSQCPRHAPPVWLPCYADALRQTPGPGLRRLRRRACVPKSSDKE